MKLLFIFTGGTIGSTQMGNVISADAEKLYKIIHMYGKRYGIDFEYDVIEPYTELSENNSGVHIKKLVTCVKNNLNKDYDGIIVTHGSDTLQYSAAAIGYCVGLNSLPICIVASNAPIESANSNAMDNLHGAINFVKQEGGKGAFVVYRNEKSDTVCVHRATRLVGSLAYSDKVTSAGEMVYGCFDSDFKFVKNNKFCEKNDEMIPLDISDLEEESREIMIINGYPAMIYPEIPSGVKYVILNTYHSGTLNTKSQSLIDFLNNAKVKNVKVYATGISDGAQYESTQVFGTLGIEPIKNISPISAYVKLWIVTSMKKDPEEFMNRSICGDVVC